MKTAVSLSIVALRERQKCSYRRQTVVGLQFRRLATVVALPRQRTN